MPRFKIGDKVKVKSLEALMAYPNFPHVGDDIMTSSMKKLYGSIFTIKTVTSHGSYRVHEAMMNWTEEMFEVPNEFIKDIYANF